MCNAATSVQILLMHPPGMFQEANLYCREWWRRVQHTRNMFWIRWCKKFIKLFFICFFIFILDIYFTNTNKQINTVKPIANYKFIWKFKFASSLLKTKIVLLTWPLKNKIQSWIKKTKQNWGKASPAGPFKPKKEEIQEHFVLRFLQMQE